MGHTNCGSYAEIIEGRLMHGEHVQLVYAGGRSSAHRSGSGKRGKAHFVPLYPSKLNGLYHLQIYTRESEYASARLWQNELFWSEWQLSTMRFSMIETSWTDGRIS